MDIDGSSTVKDDAQYLLDDYVSDDESTTSRKGNVDSGLSDSSLALLDKYAPFCA